MFRYWKHAFLVVPSLVTGRPLQTEHDLDADLGSISLYVPEISGAINPEDRQLRFDVLESTNVCGYGNITINRQLLPQALDGSGQGSIQTDTGRDIEAKWQFRCLNVGDRPYDQLLDFRVEAVDGVPVRDVSFLIRFHQTVPVRISGGDFYLTPNTLRTPTPPTNGSEVDDSNDGDDDDDDDEAEEPTASRPNLDQELADLNNLAAQLALLEKQIKEKEKHLTRVFGWRRPHGEESEMEKCDTLKCKLTALFNKCLGIQQMKENSPSSAKEDNTLVTQGVSKGGENPEPPPPYSEGEKPLTQEEPSPPPTDHAPEFNHPIAKLASQLYDYGFSLWWTIPMAVPIIYILLRFFRRIRFPSARAYKEQKRRRRCEQRKSSRARLFWSLVTFAWLARSKKQHLVDEEKEAIPDAGSDEFSTDASDDDHVVGPGGRPNDIRQPPPHPPPPPPPPSSTTNSRARSDSVGSSASSVGRRSDCSNSESESEDDMQREIAALRVAADVVGNMLTGAPGSMTRRYSQLLPGWRRAMQWQQGRQRPAQVRGQVGWRDVGSGGGCGRPRSNTPPSPTFLGYESDETLPRYSPPENGSCSSEDESEDERAARIERTSRYRMER